MMLYAVTFLVNMTKVMAPVKIPQMFLCYGGLIRTHGAFENSVGASHGVRRDTFFKSAIIIEAVVLTRHMLLHILRYTPEATSVKRTWEKCYGSYVLTIRIMSKPILSIATLTPGTIVIQPYVLKNASFRTPNATLAARTFYLYFFIIHTTAMCNFKLVTVSFILAIFRTSVSFHDMLPKRVIT